LKETRVHGKPRVSIGMPVFNGEKYIEEALDSILSQTYQDFEVIISDNASSDQTPKICREYASRDSRIHYYRNEKNLGATINHNRVFNLSKGDYFKWASYDDVLAQDFLSKCVSVLDEDPSIVLCHSKTRIIGENGEIIGTYDYNLRINSQKPHERFYDLISLRYKSWPLIFGLIRSNSLRKTSLFGNYIGSDRNLMAELSLLGRIYEIPEYLFYRRIHPQTYTERKYKTIKDKLNWWTQARGLPFPYVKICLEYFKIIKLFPLARKERLLCYLQIIKWLFREGFFLMGRDIGTILLEGSIVGSYLSPIVNRFFVILGFKPYEG